MSRITWSEVGQRIFEAGVDRGVLYVGNSSGVVWNGLVSITEEPTGGETRAYYIDGVKYLNRSAIEEFEGTIVAYTYPKEFGVCDGTASIKNGLFATQHQRKPFGLSYRTKIGNDLKGVEYAYKIHLIYGATASPTTRAHSSIGDSVSPDNFSWKITTKPPLFSGIRPTSHFIIDSRETPYDLLMEIENILYGSLVEEPRLPTVHELLYIFNSYNLSIFDAGDPNDPYYNTFDGGVVPVAQTSNIDGGFL